MVYLTDGRLGGHRERQARRYDVAQPVRFRTTEGAWVDGTTVNMSAAGVLIRTRQSPAPETPIVLQIALSGDPYVGSHIGCSGHVLRTESIEGTSDFLMAVTIDNFELRRASIADEDAKGQNTGDGDSA